MRKNKKLPTTGKLIELTIGLKTSEEKVEILRKSGIITSLAEKLKK